MGFFDRARKALTGAPVERVIYQDAPGPRITAQARRRHGKYGAPSREPAGSQYLENFYRQNAYSNGYSLVHLNLIRILIQTSPFLRAYLKQGQHSVVGFEGPTPSFAKVSNPTDKRRLEEAWKEWTVEVGVSGNDDFVSVLNSLVISHLTDGRSLAVTKLDSDYNMGIGILPLSRDWLAGQFMGGSPTEKVVDGESYKCRNGTLYKKNGRIYGFELYKEDPCLSRSVTNAAAFGFARGMESVVVPFSMVSDFTCYAAPWNCDFIPEELLSIIESTNHVTDMDSSVLKLMKVTINRLGMGIISEDPNNPTDSVQDSADPDAAADKFDELPLQVEPGLYHLPGSEKLDQFTPSMPSAGQERYRTRIEMNMAAALGQDHASLSGDLQNTTYSSARHGMLQARDAWRAHQKNLESKVLRKIMSTWLDWVYGNGILRLIGGRRTLAEACHSPWRHRGFPWIDPARDAISIKNKMAMAITSPQREANAQGENFLDLLDELAEAKRLMQERNILPADIHALAGIAAKGNSDAAPPPDKNDDDRDS